MVDPLFLAASLRLDLMYKYIVYFVSHFFVFHLWYLKLKFKLYGLGRVDL